MAGVRLQEMSVSGGLTVRIVLNNNYCKLDHKIELG